MRIAAAAAMLLLGASLYVLFRPDAVFLMPFSAWLPEPLPAGEGVVARVLRCNAADALWYAALLALMPAGSPPRGILVRCAVALPFVHEGCQGVGIVPGTFDIMDLVAYISALSIYTLLWKKELRRQDARASFSCSHS
ncbi:MAG: hypothetical protein K2L27_01060 [Muribaculaceae bacterium]|nr:hypothetical protein [Muribaculaceae bacterium]